MIKKTLYFGNPAYLSLRNKQLVVKLPEVEINDSIPEELKKQSQKTIPIEDIGIVILDNNRITITQGLIESLLENNTALITCDSSRMPLGLMLPLSGNKTQTERFRDQINASLPLKKQLWQQTVQAKIKNQAYLLLNKNNSIIDNMKVWANDVKSGDPDNYEARAAVYYWANLFNEIEELTETKFDKNYPLPPGSPLTYHNTTGMMPATWSNDTILIKISRGQYLGGRGELLPIYCQDFNDTIWLKRTAPTMEYDKWIKIPREELIFKNGKLISRETKDIY